jgi:hypothetical protein
MVTNLVALQLISILGLITGYFLDVLQNQLNGTR